VPEGLNERKLGAIIILIMALIAPAMILTAYAENGFHPNTTIHMHRETMTLQKPQVKEDIASINTTLAIYNSEDRSNPINTMKLGQIAQSSSAGVAVCVNGTYVNCTVSPLFVIRAGDTAVVNMIVPYKSFPNALSMLHSANVTSVTVLTNQAMYYVECSSSGGVSG
jgi:hypothetical protein